MKKNKVEVQHEGFKQEEDSLMPIISPSSISTVS